MRRLSYAAPGWFTVTWLRRQRAGGDALNRWAELVLVALAWGWLTTGTLWMDASSPGLGTLAEALPYLVLWIPVVIPAAALVRRRPIEGRHRWRRAIAFVGLGILSGTVHAILVFAVSAVCLPVPTPLAICLVVSLTYGQFFYWIVVTITHASHDDSRCSGAAVQSYQLEAQLATARLELLRMRIHPDIVLGRLHAIAERLRDHDPAGADGMLVSLGDELRAMLDEPPAATVEAAPEPGDAPRAESTPAGEPSVPGTLASWLDWRAETILLVAWNALVLAPVLSWYLVSHLPVGSGSAVPLSVVLPTVAGSLIRGCLWVLLCLPLGICVQRYRIERPHRLRRLVAYSGLGVLVSALHRALAFSVTWLVLDRYARFSGGSPTGELIGVVSYGQMTFGLMLAIKHIWYYRLRYEERLARSARLSAQLSEAQLRALEMQVHPHFIFNTLHSLSELMHVDPMAGGRMLEKLMEFLGLTLTGSRASLVTVAQEMKFVELYFEIQRIRFQSRLHVEFAVAPETLALWIPNLILQPLAENAIKHGIARRAEGGRVRVTCHARSHCLEIRVENKVGGDDTRPRVPPTHMGIGLANTEGRLRQLYGERYGFRLDRSDAGAAAVVTIPLDACAPRA